jgi:hypothetical protein
MWLNIDIYLPASKAIMIHSLPLKNTLDEEKLLQEVTTPVWGLASKTQV